MRFTTVLALVVIIALLAPETVGWRRRRRRRCPYRNCSWSSWSSYSNSCYGACRGSGTRTSTRYVTVNAQCGGTCNGGRTRTRACTGNCNGHGSWTSSGGYCRCNSGYTGTCCQTAIQCPSLDSPRNGRVSSSSTRYGARVCTTCNTGYRLTGSSCRTCSGGGYWSGSPGYCAKVSCPHLSPPAHCSMIGRTSYGDVLTFTCNTGYRMTGTSRLTCRSSGTWSASTPTCRIIHCSNLPAPTHGSVSGGYAYQDIKTFICDAGYELVGSGTRECTGSGTWTGTQPVCNRKKCSALQAPSHGSISGTFFLGESVTFTCIAKYELVGSSTRTCQTTQQWTGSQPTCVEKKCPTLSIPANGQMTGGTVVGDLLRFTCNLGYRLVGNSRLLCQDNKSWNGSRPNCEKIVCPPPDVPPNCDVNGGRTYGDTVTYTCDVGYRLDGTGTRVCLATAAWSDTAPRCEKKRCQILFPPLHGSVSGGNSYMDIMSYTCDTGYDLIGSPSRTCQANQQWSGSPPTCELVKCSILNPPVEGSMNGGNNYNDTVYFTCAPGHDLTGSSNRTCQADGLWSGTQPSCSALECPELDAPLNGETTGGTSVGSFLIFFCKEGFDLTGGDFMRTCQNDQTWSGTQPTCERKTCLDLPMPLHGNKTGGNLCGDVVTYTCAAGYDLTGDATRTCQTNGQWSGTQPSCSRVQCPTLSPIPNGQMSGGTLFGQQVSFVCNSGYELSGSQSRMCQSDGLWSGTQPSCIPINCSELIPPQNGIIAGGNKLGDAAVYVCAEGYEIQGSAVRFCTTDQTWSGEETTCERTECPQLDPPPNGGKNGTNYYGDTVMFDCDVGYNLHGDQYRTCQSNQGWSGGHPHCEKVRCPSPASPTNGVVSAGTYYGDIASYSCYPGYELAGSSTQTCQADGLWSGTVPTCDRKQCTPLGAPANGNLTGGFFYGDQVTFSCDTGFELTNNDVRVCGDNGVWSGVQPTCDVVECSTLQAPPNSDMAVSGNTFGNTATTSCDPGYDLVNGDTVRSCQASGEWSGSSVLCQKTCCVQPYLQHGSYNGTTCYNDTVSLECYNGYDMTSEDSDLTCTESGTWDKPIPRCDKSCCDASISVENGYVTAPSGYCFSSTIQILCNEGYKLSGNANILYCNASGLWQGETITCERISCGDPGEVRNGQRILTGIFHGDTVTYICDPGFVLVGNETHTCTEEGWGVPPYCEASNLCNRTHLSAPKDGSKVCFDSPQGTITVEYCQMHCNSPLVYTATSSSMYECSVNTAWRWQVRQVYSGVTTYSLVSVAECSPPLNPFIPITVSPLVITVGAPLDMQAIEDEMKYQLGQLSLCNNPCEIGSITVQISNARRRTGGVQYQISVQLRAYADPALITPTNTIQMEWVRIAGILRQQAMELQELVQTGGLVLSVGDQNLSVADNGITISNPSLGCKEGQIMQGIECFPCGPGTYHDTFDGICRPCGYASYQDEFGQTECKPCPGKFTTEGPGAKDISECKEFADCNCGIHPCLLNSTGYFCHCLVGYQQMSEQTCEDIDECADPDICPNAMCINRPGGYSCQCLPGYDEPHCADIDECRYVGFCPDHSTCTNTEGDYYCTCEQGYQGDNCEDINECRNATLNTCGPNQVCVNTAGSFQCDDCTMFHGKCFTVSDTSVTFSESEEKCAAGGGTVVTVKDQHVQDFLVQLLSVSNKDVWIGLTDRDVEGQFMWSDGSQLAYSAWAPGEPNGDITKNCVHLWPLANFRWDDMPCGRNNYYICQYTTA
ncbi:sushi, von Willebrand factor type A, EGF and pentraxin domain-containing protein 1-like [Branchiostoma floridae x Branchiostoma belcheri]